MAKRKNSKEKSKNKQELTQEYISNFEYMPPEIQLMILSNLNYKSLAELSSTNKNIKSAINEIADKKVITQITTPLEKFIANYQVYKMLDEFSHLSFQEKEVLEKKKKHNNESINFTYEKNKIYEEIKRLVQLGASFNDSHCYYYIKATDELTKLRHDISKCIKDCENFINHNYLEAKFSYFKNLEKTILNMKLTDKYDNSLLHSLVVHEQPKLIDILTSQGANLNIKNKEGNTPLHFAVMYERNKVIPNLILAGAKTNAVNNLGETPMHILCSKHFGLLNEFDKSNLDQIYNLLMIPARNTKGVEINIRAKNGLTPFHNLCLFNSNEAEMIANFASIIVYQGKEKEVFENIKGYKELSSFNKECKENLLKIITSPSNEMLNPEQLENAKNLIKVCNLQASDQKMVDKIIKHSGLSMASKEIFKNLLPEVVKNNKAVKSR